MAGERDLLTRLRPQLDQLGDDALAALASAGLLRRARKDLQGLSPSLSDSGERLVVDLGEHQVTFDVRGPSQARCTCPATTTCHHVLSGWLFLRTASGAGESPPASSSISGQSAAKELLEVSLQALIAFAGLPAVREAAEAVEDGDLPEISAGPPLMIRLLKPTVELRYAGGGLDAFVLEYSGKRRKKLIAHAVLAFQRASGIAAPALPEKKGTRSRQPKESAGQAVPRKLLEQVQRTLEECTAVGVAHLSDALVERFLSHAAAAEGQELHRLALSLNRLANHIDLQLERSSATSTEQLFEELGRAYALCTAIQAAGARVLALWGEARSTYEAVPELELVGVAAEPWETGSGYCGLTLLLWAPSLQRWVSATDARPAGTSGFDPVARYRLAGPWPGLESPAGACGRRVRLKDAGLNRLGRLSLSESSRAHVQGLESWPDFGEREFDDWIRLRSAAPGLLPQGGLAEYDPHDAYVVLRGRRWKEPRFDPNRQELTRELEDSQGETFPVRLKFGRRSEQAISRVEALGEGEGTCVVARLDRARRELCAHPLAVLREDEALRTDNLFLDQPQRETLASALLQRLRSFVSRSLETESRTALPQLEEASSATDRRLRALERELLRLAERGVAGLSDSSHSLRALTSDLRSAGLDFPEVPREVRSLPETVLRLRYIMSVLQVLRG